MTSPPPSSSPSSPSLTPSSSPSPLPSSSPPSPASRSVAEAVGAALAALGADQVFGVVGSGNFHVTNALVAHGARFIATRHEAGATTAADAYARLTGRVGVVTVHQGCGLTNAMTGLAEAAKSRTPLIVLAAEATAPRSNFRVDQDALAEAVGATSRRIESAETAVADATSAWHVAANERRTVVLNLPLDIQSQPVPAAGPPGGPASAAPARAAASSAAVAAASAAVPAASAAVPAASVALPASSSAVAASSSAVAASSSALGVASDLSVVALASLLAEAGRPVFIAGRGALHAAAELTALAETCGALLATSAVAKGLFTGNPWNLDVSGGFATPVAADLIAGADVIVAWGSSLNMWTTRHGALLPPTATVVQVDLDESALGAHGRVDLGMVGDVRATAEAVRSALRRTQAESRSAQKGSAEEPGHAEAGRGYRTPEVEARLAAGSRWRDVPYEDDGDATHVDPRTLTIALDDLLPAERVVAVDSGNFMGYPAMFLSVPDHRGFCFTQAFQSIGLGLASALGAALAVPGRLPVAACGDGGFLMAIAELETVARLGLGMLIVVYNDNAYGAEVHHFGPGGHPLSTVVFPDTDIASIARGHGCAAVTVRAAADLGPVAAWLAGPRDVPMVVDAKVSATRPSWWLEEAFRGH
ncbi:thiamine pyrophosphate-binding protein [Actinoplanes sp. CA-030573]|uniref:thiamine pyrophosphate-binding protein n=1 Tax=Actinoplanes sp. CA-030573 TaxID=3239898 RepID=UPI003D8AD5B8